MNGDFDDATAWSLTGEATIEGGAAVLREDERFLSGLSQRFVLPAEARGLRFTITGATLGAAGDAPPDAFEVALLDDEGSSIVGEALGLSMTDALLNVQADGTAFFASGVTLTGVPESGGVVDLAAPIVVSIDFDDLAAGTEVTLYFDLLGFGALDSEVRIDDVRFIVSDAQNTAPAAAGDAATLAEDSAVIIAVLVNDSDADGDALSVTLQQGPAHGTVQLNANGSVTYTPHADFYGTDSFTYRLNDGQADSNVASVSLTVTPVNDAPQVAIIADVALDEGEALGVVLAASDVEGDALTYSLDEAPAGAAIDASGAITWQATDGDAQYEFTVRVSDGTDSTTRSFTVDVSNVVPTLAAAGAEEIEAGKAYEVFLFAADPGDDTLAQWTIDWGDGTASVLDGAVRRASHVYTAALGVTTIEIQVSDEDGTWALVPLDMEVTPLATLQVTDFESDGNGFHVRFNDAFDAGAISLYGAGTAAADDIVLRGDAAGLVRGSFVVDGDGMGLRFLKTGTPLAADRYSLALKGGPGGFANSQRGALDGNANGLAGDNFLAQFTVAAGTGIRLGLPDFMRGPGQVVAVPSTAAGLPLTLTSAGDVASLAFELHFDPALLQITDAQPAAGWPQGATLLADLSQPGVAAFSIELPAGQTLPAGAVALLNLVARVPDGAVYASRHYIDMRSVEVNGQVVVSADDDAFHLVGYLGDANANAFYDRTDVSLVQRVALKLDTGFAAWDDIDPLFIADIDGNGVITGTDASRVLQEQSGYDRPEIPAVPLAPSEIVFSAPQTGGVGGLEFEQADWLSDWVSDRSKKKDGWKLVLNETD